MIWLTIKSYPPGNKTDETGTNKLMMSVQAEVYKIDFHGH